MRVLKGVICGSVVSVFMTDSLAAEEGPRNGGEDGFR